MWSGSPELLGCIKGMGHKQTRRVTVPCWCFGVVIPEKCPWGSWFLSFSCSVCDTVVLVNPHVVIYIQCCVSASEVIWVTEFGFARFVTLAITAREWADRAEDADQGSSFPRDSGDRNGCPIKKQTPLSWLRTIRRMTPLWIGGGGGGGSDDLYLDVGMINGKQQWTIESWILVKCSSSFTAHF